MRRVVVAPMRWESEAVRRVVEGLQRIDAPFPAWRGNALTLVECGIGPERAARVIDWLEEVDELWLVGVAGGLIDGLETGDVLLADSVIADGERLPCEAEAELRVRLGEDVRVGPALSSARVLVTPEEKRAAARTGALAVEMEAAPLARWAAERGVRFVHLRVVLDPVYSPVYGADVVGDGRGRFRPLIGALYLLTHPRALRAMLDSRRRAPVALEALSDLLARALADA